MKFQQQVIAVLLFAGLLGVVGFVKAAAPTNVGVYNAIKTTQTIDTDHTGTWEVVDSMIVQQDDSCYSPYTIIGTAALDPGDVLYIGFKRGKPATGAATDTFTISLPREAQASVSQKFGFTLFDTLNSQTDSYDTVYITAAVKGNTNAEQVIITNVRCFAPVINK